MLYVDAFACWAVSSAANAAGVLSAAAAWSVVFPPRSARGLRRLLWLLPAATASAWLAGAFDHGVMNVAADEARWAALRTHVANDLLAFAAFGWVAVAARRTLAQRRRRAVGPGPPAPGVYLPTDLRGATEGFIAAVDRADLATTAAAYDPEFLCVRVADEGGFARLSREQMMAFLAPATASPSSHAEVRTGATTIHHAETMRDFGFVLLTRTKDLGNGWEPLFYVLLWKRHAGGWRLVRELVHQRTVPRWARA